LVQIYLTVFVLAFENPEAAELSWVGATKPSLDIMNYYDDL